MEYKIKTDGFKEIQKKIILTTVPMSLIAVSVGVYISTVNTKSNENDINVLPFIIPLLICLLGYGLYKSIKRQKIIFESYRLVINEEHISREQFNTSIITIPLMQIASITKYKNGTIIIIGKNKGDTIVVPTQVENYDEIEQKLDTINPIKAIEKVNILQKNSRLFGFATIALMLCVYTLENKIIIGISGSVLVCFLIWGFITLRKNKNIDNKTKKGLWWILVVSFSIIMSMFFKLTGKQ